MQLLKKGYLDAFWVVLIWSGFVLVSRVGGKSELLAYDIVALRFATAALFLVPFWWFRNRMNWLQPKIVALGLTGGIGYCTLVYYGFKHAPVAHAGILLPGLLPFEMMVMSWLLLKEKPSRGRVIGLCLIGIGVLCLAVENMSVGFATLIGDASFVAAGTMWALYSVLVKKWKVSPWDATVGCALVSFALYMPVYFLFLPKQFSVAPWDAIMLQAFYQGVMAMIVAMIFYMRAMKELGPSKLGLFMALVPVISGVAAIPLLNEELTLWIMLGLMFTSLGAWRGSREN